MTEGSPQFFRTETIHATQLLPDGMSSRSLMLPELLKTMLPKGLSMLGMGHCVTQNKSFTYRLEALMIMRRSYACKMDDRLC